jgi:hypothetical protein
MKNMTFDKKELDYILRGLSSMKTMYHLTHNWNTRTEHCDNVGFIIEKIQNRGDKRKNITFDKKELDYILGGLYNKQQSYKRKYFPHENPPKYQHFLNIRLIIKKIEGEQKKRRAR